jgi:hypothetical protein
MTRQKTDLQGPQVPHRAAEHLTDRWAGVFFPELVNHCVAGAHTALAAGARFQNRLGPIAVHAAENRLASRARAKGSPSAPVRQVLFVDAHDTGATQIAAGLLAHHAGTAVVARSAGIDPGTAVDPYAVEVLAQHGTEPTGLVPKPVDEAVLRAADWVITLGLHDALLVGSGAMVQDWPLGPPLDGDQHPATVADLDNRVQALWVEISTSAATTPPRRGPRF